MLRNENIKEKKKELKKIPKKISKRYFTKEKLYSFLQSLNNYKFILISIVIIIFISLSIFIISTKISGKNTSIESKVENMSKNVFTVMADGGGRGYTPDLKWGVLTMNSNKATYYPNENANIAIAVLDGNGKMVCDADVKLEVITPNKNIKTFLTLDKTITVNPECSIYDITAKPDFETNFLVDEIGVYTLNLTATTPSGTQTVSDNFEVSNNHDFDIERFTNTRIFPQKAYGVTIDITAHQDFEGTLVETVPSDFEITPLSSTQVFQNIVVNNGLKYIQWPVNLKKDEFITLGYTYDAPDISPELFFIDQLKFISTNGEIISEEARPWYIASDLPTKQGDGLMIYGVSANTNPQLRTYDGSTNKFAGAGNTISGNTGVNFVIKTSPKKQEAIAGYVNSTGTLQVMCYDGTTWTNEWTASLGGTGSTRRFDIDYESSTGNVIVLYSINAATLTYRTKPNSSTCGSANWAVAASFTPTRTTGVIQWVKLASDPRSTSNVIAAIWADANSDLSSRLWNGTSWANEPTTALSTTLQVVTAAQDVDDFSLAFESLTGNLMVVWGDSTGANGTNGVRYARCTGGSATCTWSAITTPPTFADDATNLDLAANPNSNEMVFGSIGKAGSDMQIGYWSGTAWTDTANVDISCATPVAGSRLISVGWLISGSTTRSIVVYNDSNTTGVNWYTGNAGTFSLQTDATPTPLFGNPQKWYDIQTDPFNKDRLIFSTSDANNAVSTERVQMSSTGTFTWSDPDGGAVLNSSLPQATTNPYSFSYWNFIPPSTFDESGYRFFRNSDFNDPSAVLSNPSANSDYVRAFAKDSTFMYLAGDDFTNGTTNNQWRIEKRRLDNGSLDTTFGSGTGIITENPSTGNDNIKAMAIDNNYMYIIGSDDSTKKGNTNYLQWRVEKRLLTTGALETTQFGSATGIITSNFSSNDEEPAAIVIDSSYMYIGGFDKIPGATNSEWRIEKRLLTTGALETTQFGGTSGFINSNASSGEDRITSMTRDSTYLYITGYDSTPGNTQWRTEKRLLTTGALDTNFGSSGVITVNPSANSDQANSITNDGTYIYIAGYDQSNGSTNDQWRVEKRLTTNGSFDTNFGTGGTVTSNPTANTDQINSIAIDSSYMYLGGNQKTSTTFEGRIEKRLLSNGNLETTSFGNGTGYIVYTPTSGDAEFFKIRITASTIYAAGYNSVVGNVQWRIGSYSITTGDNYQILSGKNSPATLSATSAPFRLRLLIHVGSNTLNASGQAFKLQFAGKGSGTCLSPSGTPSTYTDVTTTTAISFYNNPSLNDGDNITSVAADPSHNTDSIKAQSYEEANNFTNAQSAINIGEDGEWDFALFDNGAPISTTYCLRASISDGSLLSNYSQIPEVSTAPNPSFSQNSFMFYDNANSLIPGNTKANINTSFTQTYLNTPFRLRMLLNITGNNLSLSGQAFKMQFAGRGTGTCSAPSGTPSTYTDITTTTAISFYDNSSITDNSNISATNNDPYDSANDVYPQTYEEANNFTNSQYALTNGDDSEWDFSLIDNSALPNTSYCLRAVKSDGTVINYNQFPQITTTSFPTFNQSAYKFYTNQDSYVPSVQLAAQDTPSSLSTVGAVFRLRLLIHINTANLAQNAQSFKLQFAGRGTGSCSAPSGTPSTYTDITTTSSISYYNNSTPTDLIDGNALTQDNTNDPKHVNDTNVVQTYEEANNFTNSQSSIQNGQDGIWDFSLFDNSVVGTTTYCIRAVKGDGSALENYDQYPTIRTATTGTLSTDIVDGTGSSVSTPTFAMNNAIADFNCQIISGTLGNASQKIRIINNSSNSLWSVTIAPTNGASALWDAGNGNPKYDFNDPSGTGCGSGSDGDNVGGQLTINPFVLSLTPQAGCATNGIVRGNSTSYDFSTGTNSITIATSDLTTPTNCYWDITNIGITQKVPPSQNAYNYKLNMTISVIAN